MLYALNGIIPSKVWRHNPYLQNNDGKTVEDLLSDKNVTVPGCWHNFLFPINSPPPLIFLQRLWLLFSRRKARKLSIYRGDRFLDTRRPVQDQSLLSTHQTANFKNICYCEHKPHCSPKERRNCGRFQWRSLLSQREFYLFRSFQMTCCIPSVDGKSLNSIPEYMNKFC